MRTQPIPAQKPGVKPARRLLRWITYPVLVVTGLAFSALLFAAVAYILFRLSDRLAPGVSVAGVPVGGMPSAEAAAALDRVWNREARLVVVDASDPNRIWQAPPSDFGLRLDAEASAARALAVGRHPNWLQGLSDLIAALEHGAEVPAAVVLDEAAARAGLDMWGRRTSVEPVEAVLEIHHGEVVASAGRAGKALAMQATFDLLRADPHGALLTYQMVPLIFKPIQPDIADVASAAAEVERLLTSQPILRAYDPVRGEYLRWSPSLETIASWIRIERGPGEFEVRIDASALQGYVAGLNDSLGPEREFDTEQAVDTLVSALQGAEVRSLVIRYHERSHVVGPGETWVSIGVRAGLPYWKVLEANPQAAGRNPIPGETIVIPPRDAMLPLPVVVDKRIVISISQQHLWAYQDGEVLRDFVISTGIARSPTLPGIFQVQSHIPNAYASNWDLYMPHFLGIYEAVPGFWNGIHGLPLLSSGVRLWANVLGRPASYGCIILDLPSAEWLYNWADEGVVVEIQR